MPWLYVWTEVVSKKYLPRHVISLSRYSKHTRTSTPINPGNHLITKMLLELKSFPLKHDVVLQWNEKWLVFFTIRASVELERTDFVLVAKIIKVIFIYFHLKKSSPFFHLLFFIFIEVDLLNKENSDIKNKIFFTSTKFLSQWKIIVGKTIFFSWRHKFM